MFSCWRTREWDCRRQNAWRQKVLWNILLQTRVRLEAVRRRRRDAHLRIRNKKEHATCVSLAGKKQPTNIPRRFDIISSALDKGAWSSRANWKSSSNPLKRHDTKVFPVRSSWCKLSPEQQAQNFRDISGRLNQHRPRNLCPVTKDPAEEVSEVCQHCAPNGCTCTRPILASHEKFDDDDDNHAYQDTNAASGGQAPHGLVYFRGNISVKEIRVRSRTSTQRFMFLAVRALFTMSTRCHRQARTHADALVCAPGLACRVTCSGFCPFLWSVCFSQSLFFRYHGFQVVSRASSSIIPMIPNTLVYNLSLGRADTLIRTLH